MDSGGEVTAASAIMSHVVFVMMQVNLECPIQQHKHAKYTYHIQYDNRLIGLCIFDKQK